MLAEGELRSNLDDSDRVRDLQDKVADLKAEVIFLCYRMYRYIRKPLITTIQAQYVIYITNFPINSF